ncbi:MAG: hypothetical protein ACP5M0_15170, partial [Desulfomonilaceae bacterium]
VATGDENTVLKRSMSFSGKMTIAGARGGHRGFRMPRPQGFTLGYEKTPRRSGAQVRRTSVEVCHSHASGNPGK